jgi:intein/homing endonuclease
MFNEWPKIEAFHHLRNRIVKNRLQIDGFPVAYKAKIKIHGCVQSETLITLADGSDIFIKDVEKGMSVYSYDPTKRQYTIKRVKNTFRFRSDKKWVELVFDTGRTIRCTEDHKFFTKNRGWVEAKNLTALDDFVLDIEVV